MGVFEINRVFFQKSRTLPIKLFDHVQLSQELQIFKKIDSRRGSNLLPPDW